MGERIEVLWMEEDRILCKTNLGTLEILYSGGCDRYKKEELTDGCKGW